MSEIAELFARDPLLHTEEDVEKMIAEFRKNRKAFNLNPASGAGSAAAAKKKKKAADLGIDLSDIFS